MEDAIEQALQIRKAVHLLSNVKEACTLEEFGLYIDSNIDSDETESTEGETSESDDKCSSDVMESASDHQFSNNPEGPNDLESALLPNEHLLLMLRENNHNWFAFVEELNMTLCNATREQLNQALIDFMAFLSSTYLSNEEQILIEQSYKAFMITDGGRPSRESFIELDSESDDPENWIDVGEGLMDKMKSHVVNERKKQRDRQRFLKMTAEKCLLKRKVPKRASKLLKQFPNLGKDIDDFVHENRIGADAWRRTGVATFDGNVKSGPRVT